jgi:hypothetical protein
MNDRAKFDEMMKVPSSHNGEAESIEAVGDSDNGGTNILIGVISSRANFKTRVGSIIATWGSQSNIPEEVTIRYFVGAAEASTGIISGSDEDLENLAREAGFADRSQIVVMKDVTDDEYPPVRKNSAMIKHLEKFAADFEDDLADPSTFQWAFKVDDDAYVNFDGLLNFLKKRKQEGFHVYGERGTGRPEDRDGLAKGGLTAPYCTGGPGYVLSRDALRQTAAGMDDCVSNADTSEYREYLWHSDVVIGMCVHKQTGAGCWNDADYDKYRVFRHNLKAEDNFIEDQKLPTMVSMHPFKDDKSMLQLHTRYVDSKA